MKGDGCKENQIGAKAGKSAVISWKLRKAVPAITDMKGLQESAGGNQGCHFSECFRSCVEEKSSGGYVKRQVRNAVEGGTKVGAPVEAPGDKTVQHVRYAGRDEEGQEDGSAAISLAEGEKQDANCTDEPDAGYDVWQVFHSASIVISDYPRFCQSTLRRLYLTGITVDVFARRLPAGKQLAKGRSNS